MDFSGATFSVLSRFSGWKIVTELTSNLSIIVLANVINFKTISSMFPPLLSRSFPPIWMKTCSGWWTRTQEINVSIYSLFVIRQSYIPRKFCFFMFNIWFLDFAPLLADLFHYLYEAELIQRFLRKSKRSFKSRSTSRNDIEDRNCTTKEINSIFPL